jgi:hypothetical protein
MNIQDFDIKLKTFSKKRYNEFGEKMSGLYDYYHRYYLNNEYFYFKHEIELMNYINREYDKNIKILEIACGCGQISLGLSGVFNFKKVFANELDQRRLDYGEYLNSNLHTEEQLKHDNKVNFIKDNFMNLDFNIYDLLIITNIRHKNIGISQSEYTQILDFLKANNTIILLPNLYGMSDAKENIYNKIKTNKNIDITQIYESIDEGYNKYPDNSNIFNIVKLTYKN